MEQLTSQEKAAARAVMAEQRCRKNSQGRCYRSGHPGLYVDDLCPDALQTARAVLRAIGPTQRPAHAPAAERRLVETLTYLLGQYDRAVLIHAQVVMDTPADQAVHDQAVAALREAATPARDLLRQLGHDNTNGEAAQLDPLRCSCQQPTSAQLDRTLCACNDMHFHCDECGLRTDPCPLAAGG